MTEAEERLAAVQVRIASAARQSGREPADVRLVAVSKTFGAEAIEPLLQAGQRDFGENCVQEARGKWPGLRARFADVRLHLIGPLQTNKVREAVALFDAIHSVDRDKLAAGIGLEVAKQNRALSIFVQVNTGAEAQKAGISPQDAAAFVARCRDTHRLVVEGLMCLPPADADPAPHFALLRRLAAELDLRQLSMGMSGDFETAIREGATLVRVGSALFGSRSGQRAN